MNKLIRKYPTTNTPQNQEKNRKAKMLAEKGKATAGETVAKPLQKCKSISK